MTATDKLRELLEEHGIKHFDYDKGGRTQTQWAAPDGTRYFTYETYNNPSKTAKLVISWFPTPEQAIAATLGRRDCKLRDCEGSFSAVNRPVWLCDCGAFMTQYTDATTYHKPNYCPNCGARVERSCDDRDR